MTKEQRTRYGIAAVAALLTAALYLPSLGNDFVIWDDYRYVVENLHIRSLDLAFLKWSFGTVYLGNWHPLTWLSHAIDHALWGLDPAGHHLTSIVLHSANTFLVVLLCAKLLGPFAGRAVPAFLEGKRTLIAAGAAGLLFGLHPLHVENVAWIADRKDLLCAFFALLSVLVYASHVRAQEDAALPAGSGRPRFTGPLLLSLVFFLFALMSKSVAVGLPLVLLLLDWHPFGRIRSLRTARIVAAEKAPFLALALAAAIAAVAAQHAGGLAGARVTVVPLAVRLLVAAKALVLSLVHLAVPAGLVPFYPYPTPHQMLEHWLSFALAVLALLALTAAALFSARRNRLWAAVWGSYLVLILPVSGVIRVGGASMADRYAYLPGLGYFLFAGLSAAWVWRAAGERGPWARRGAAAFALVIVLLLAAGTVRQTMVWKDSISRWSAVIERYPRELPFAYVDRGWAYKMEEQYELAARDFTTALALNPASPPALNNRAVVYQAMGKFELAHRDFDRALELNPSYAKAYANRGILFAENGRFGEAIADFSRALALNPSYADVYTSRGLVLMRMGRIEQAMEDYGAAIRLDPENTEAYLNRGVAYERMGRPDRAFDDYARAIALDPDDQLAYLDRAIALRMLERNAEAVKDLDRAIALEPDYVPALLERGRLYRAQGERERALRDFRRGCDLGSEEGCAAAEEIAEQK